jgi:large subunit ribosomal protein L29
MKKKEVKKLNKDELVKKVNSLKKDLFNLRFRKVNNQLQDTAKASQLKREVAQHLTSLNKKN